MSNKPALKSLSTPSVYTIHDVARAFVTTPRTLRRWIDSGKFPQPLTIPGVPRWSRDVIDNLLHSSPVKS